VIVVHAGNRLDGPGRGTPRFPESQVPAVSARVGRLLDILQPAAVVSAPAAGADLLVLDEARRRGIALHIVLARNDDDFLQSSVADHGAGWVARYRAVLDHARGDSRCTVCPMSELSDHADADGDDRYLAANAALIRRALDLARDEPVVALSIRPPGGETPPSVSDDFADRAGRAGLLVVSIDPRPTVDGQPTV
jgi:hypothetical protein